MPNNEFSRIIGNKFIRDDIIKRLSTNPLLKDIKARELEFMVENCDRDIFLKFVNNELTAD